MRSHSSVSILHALASWLVIASPVLFVAGRVPADISLSLVAILFLVRSFIIKDWQWLCERWVQLALALTVFMCVRNLWLEDAVKSVAYSAVWVRFPVFAAALAYWLLPDEKLSIYLRYSLTAVLVFLVADGALQYITGEDVFGRRSIMRDLGLRLTGPFSSPRLGISIVWLCFPALLYALGSAASKKQHIIAALFYVAVMASIFITGERMAFLFAGFGSLMAVIILKKLRLQLFVIGLASLLAGVALVIVDPAIMERQLGQTFGEIDKISDGAGAYSAGFKEGWQLTLKHPLLGVGAKRYESSCLEEIKSENPLAFCGMHPHHFYLDWLAFYGFGACALMLWMIVLWMREGMRHYAVVQANALLAGLFITLVIRFWPLATVTTQFTIWSAYPQWLMVGWFLATLNAAKRG